MSYHDKNKVNCIISLGPILVNGVIVCWWKPDITWERSALLMKKHHCSLGHSQVYHQSQIAVGFFWLPFPVSSTEQFWIVWWQFWTVARKLHQQTFYVLKGRNTPSWGKIIPWVHALHVNAISLRHHFREKVSIWFQNKFWFHHTNHDVFIIRN